jgi:hypothetical protein
VKFGGVQTQYHTMNIQLRTKQVEESEVDQQNMEVDAVQDQVEEDLAVVVQNAAQRQNDHAVLADTSTAQKTNEEDTVQDLALAQPSQQSPVQHEEEREKVCLSYLHA